MSRVAKIRKMVPKMMETMTRLLETTKIVARMLRMKWMTLIIRKMSGEITKGRSSLMSY